MREKRVVRKRLVKSSQNIIKNTYISMLHEKGMYTDCKSGKVLDDLSEKELLLLVTKEELK